MEWFDIMNVIPSFQRTFLLGIILFTMPQVQADDLEDLKTDFEAVLEQIADKDLEGFLASWHPEAILFTRNAYFPVDRNSSTHQVWNEIFEDAFATTQEAVYTPMDVSYKVIGDTGLVWGLTQVVIQPKAGPHRVENIRMTAVFKKLDEGWKILSWHDSDPPER